MHGLPNHAVGFCLVFSVFVAHKMPEPSFIVFICCHRRHFDGAVCETNHRNNFSLLQFELASNA